MRVNEENLLDLRAQEARVDALLVRNYLHPRDFDVPKKLGAGSLRYNNVLKGFLTVHGSYDLDEELEIEFSREADQHESNALEIAIMLSGRVGIPVTPHSDSLTPVEAGQFGISRDVEGHSHKAFHSSDRPIEYLVVQVAQEIIADLFNLDPGEINGLLFGVVAGAPQFQRIVPAANADMLIAARQYVNAPFIGRLQEMYREGKLLEILAFAIDSLDIHGDAAQRQRNVSKRDAESLRLARKYLLDRMEEPPSLVELAHSVGINEQKLKVGFKQMFGTTVFDYLRMHRLDEARKRLQKGGQSVSEVSLSVGYSHFGHFAASFRRRFGVSPSEIKAR